MDAKEKKELKSRYKELKPAAGVYRITNTRNQKIFIGSSLNLKTMNGKKFQLEMGSHPNKMLQQEWREWGKEAFVFEIVEVLKKKEDDLGDIREALEELEAKWLRTLQPYGERGYNG